MRLRRKGERLPPRRIVSDLDYIPEIFELPKVEHTIPTGIFYGGPSWTPLNF